MAKLNLKCSAEGTHEAYDGDRKVGEIENNHLCRVCRQARRQGRRCGARQPERAAARRSWLPTAYATFAREVGAEGRSKEEIRGLVTLALHPPESRSHAAVGNHWRRRQAGQQPPG